MKLDNNDKRRGSNAIGCYGANNTGKTVLIRKLVELFNKKRDSLNSSKYPNNYHKLVLFDPQYRLQDLMRKGDININLADEKWYERIVWEDDNGDIDGLKDSLVILDDFKMLFRGSNVLQKGVLQIFGQRMEFGIDLVFVAWHPRLLLPDLVSFFDKYYLFKTNGSEKEFRKRIEGDDEMIEVMRISLNKEYSKYSESSYAGKYPNFPFIYYDSRTGVAKRINFGS